LEAAAIRELCDSFAKVHRATRKVIACFPGDKLDWSPAKGARTPRQIIAHMYGMIPLHARAVATSEFLTKELYAEYENSIPEGGTEQVLEWCNVQFERMQQDVSRTTDERLGGTVHAFYGDYPAWKMLAYSYDEHLHHRGQLTVYLRLLGIEVPFVYDYT
jgi:uncharacterized damage-inducible protein DinB